MDLFSDADHVTEVREVTHSRWRHVLCAFQMHHSTSYWLIEIPHCHDEIGNFWHLLFELYHSTSMNVNSIVAVPPSLHTPVSQTLSTVLSQRLQLHLTSSIHITCILQSLSGHGALIKDPSYLSPLSCPIPLSVTNGSHTVYWLAMDPSWLNSLDSNTSSVSEDLSFLLPASCSLLNITIT